MKINGFSRCIIAYRQVHVTCLAHEMACLFAKRSGLTHGAGCRAVGAMVGARAQLSDIGHG